MRHQIVPGAVRKAKAKIPHCRGIQLSVSQILQPFSPLRGSQQLVIINRRFLVDRPQDLPLFFLAFGFLAVVDLRELDTGPVRQCLQGLLETVVLIFHQEGRGVSAGAASKTIEHLLGLRDRKGGRFLIMERTQAKIVGAFLL